jgi:hypothetical protein
VPRRAGLTSSLLAAVLVVAVVAGVATAGKSSDPKIESAANGTARASAYALANRIRAVQAVEGRVARSAARASSHESEDLPRTYSQKLTLASAADGPYLFAATTEYTAELRKGEYEVSSLRTRVTRTDRVAGGTTVLFDRANTYVFALLARGGFVAFQDAKYKESKRHVNIDSTVYKGATSDAKPASIASGSLKLADFNESICGEFPLLSALSDKGEVALGRAKASCAEDDFAFTANLELLRADGTRTDLGPQSLDYAVTASVTVTGDRILQPSPFERAFEIKTISTGASAGLWHPGAATADIGPDGTVALIGTTDEPKYTFTFPESEYGDVYETTSRSTSESGAGTGTGGGLQDFPMPTREANPNFRMPFVIFPQGDAENPVLVAASRARINALKFCGANLYALESKGKSADDRSEGDLIPGLGGFAPTGQSPFDVQLLDAKGTLVRSLGTTKPLTVVGVGCNVDRLLIVVQKRTGVSVVEMGP